MAARAHRTPIHPRSAQGPARRCVLVPAGSGPACVGLLRTAPAALPCPSHRPVHRPRLDFRRGLGHSSVPARLAGLPLLRRGRAWRRARSDVTHRRSFGVRQSSESRRVTHSRVEWWPREDTTATRTCRSQCPGAGTSMHRPARPGRPRRDLCLQAGTSSLPVGWRPIEGSSSPLQAEEYRSPSVDLGRSPCG